MTLSQAKDLQECPEKGLEQIFWTESQRENLIPHGISATPKDDS